MVFDSAPVFHQRKNKYSLIHLKREDDNFDAGDEIIVNINNTKFRCTITRVAEFENKSSQNPCTTLAIHFIKREKVTAKKNGSYGSIIPKSEIELEEAECF